jgi:nicotinate phosphoribosyltransferase
MPPASSSPTPSWTCPRIFDPNDNTKTKSLRWAVQREPLLVPVIRGGEGIYDPPSIDAIRARAVAQLERLDPGHKRFENPHIYPVGLSPYLNRLRDGMIAEARAGLDNGGGG